MNVVAPFSHQVVKLVLLILLLSAVFVFAAVGAVAEHSDAATVSPSTQPGDGSDMNDSMAASPLVVEEYFSIRNVDIEHVHTQYESGELYAGEPVRIDVTVEIGEIHFVDQNVDIVPYVDGEAIFGSKSTGSVSPGETVVVSFYWVPGPEHEGSNEIVVALYDIGWNSVIEYGPIDVEIHKPVTVVAAEPISQTYHIDEEFVVEAEITNHRPNEPVLVELVRDPFDSKTVVTSTEADIPVGETETVTLTWEDPGDAGLGLQQYSIETGTDSTVFTGEGHTHQFTIEDVRPMDGPAGTPLEIEATIINEARAGFSDEIELYVDGEHVGTAPVSLDGLDSDGYDSTTVTFTWEPDMDDVGEQLVEVAYTWDGSSTIAVDTIDVHKPAEFQISDGSLGHDGNVHELDDFEIDVGETLDISLWVSNPNGPDGPGATQDVTLEIDGDEVDSTALSLDGGESDGVSFEWEPIVDDTGTNTVTVATADDERQFDVEVTTDGPVFEIEILDVNDPVVYDDPAEVTYEIENTGTEAGTRTIGFDIEEIESSGVSVGETAMIRDTPTGSHARSGTAEISLDPGETKTRSYVLPIGEYLTGDREFHIAVHRQDGDPSYEETTAATIEYELPPLLTGSIETNASDSKIVGDDPLTLAVELENLGDHAGGEIAVGATNGSLDTIETIDSIEPALNVGESKTEEITWDPPTWMFENETRTIFISNSQNDLLDSITLDVQQPKTLTVEELMIEGDVVTGGTLSTEATIINTNAETIEETIELVIDGEVRSSKSIELDANDSTSVSFVWEDVDLPEGSSEVSVVGVESAQSSSVSVVDSPVSIQSFEVDSQIVVGEPLTMNTTITNLVDTPETQSVVVTVNDTVIEETQGTISGGESKDLEFEWTPTSADTGPMTVEIALDGITETRTVSVFEPAAYELSLESITDPVSAGESMEFVVNGTNVGDVASPVPLTLATFGETVVVEEAALDLAPAESGSTTIVWETDVSDAGIREVSIASPTDQINAVVLVGKPSEELRDADEDTESDVDDDSEMEDESDANGDGETIVAGGAGGGGGGFSGGGTGTIGGSGGPSESTTEPEDTTVDITRSTHVSGTDRTTSTTTSISTSSPDESVRVADADGEPLASAGNFSLDVLEITSSSAGEASVSTRVLESPDETETPELESEMNGVSASTYFEIAHDFGENITEATISTTVTSEEIDDPANASIYHYTGEQWRVLETEYSVVSDDEDATNSAEPVYKLEATTDSFSTFAVGVTSDEPTQEPVADDVREDTDEPSDDDDEDSESGVGFTIVVLLIFALIFVAVGIGLFNIYYRPE